MSKVEERMEQILFASRWLMAPFYLGLVISLALLLFKFFQKIFHFLQTVFEMKETGLIISYGS